MNEAQFLIYDDNDSVGVVVVATTQS